MLKADAWQQLCSACLQIASRSTWSSQQLDRPLDSTTPLLHFSRLDAQSWLQTASGMQSAGTVMSIMRRHQQTLGCCHQEASPLAVCQPFQPDQQCYMPQSLNIVPSKSCSLHSCRLDGLCLYTWPSSLRLIGIWCSRSILLLFLINWFMSHVA